MEPDSPKSLHVNAMEEDTVRSRERDGERDRDRDRGRMAAQQLAREPYDAAAVKRRMRGYGGHGAGGTEYFGGGALYGGGYGAGRGARKQHRQPPHSYLPYGVGSNSRKRRGDDVPQTISFETDSARTDEYSRLLNQIRQLERELQGKQELLTAKDETLRASHEALSAKDHMLRSKDEAIADRDAAIRKNEEVLKFLEDMIAAKDEIIKDWQRRYSEEQQLSGGAPPPPPAPPPAPAPRARARPGSPGLWAASAVAAADAAAAAAASSKDTSPLKEMKRKLKPSMKDNRNAKRKRGLAPDFSVAPDGALPSKVRPLYDEKKGTFVRPRGRGPLGMTWDARGGYWVPSDRAEADAEPQRQTKGRKDLTLLHRRVVPTAGGESAEGSGGGSGMPPPAAGSASQVDRILQPNLSDDFARPEPVRQRERSGGSGISALSASGEGGGDLYHASNMDEIPPPEAARLLQESFLRTPRGRADSEGGHYTYDEDYVASPVTKRPRAGTADPASPYGHRPPPPAPPQLSTTPQLAKGTASSLSRREQFPNNQFHRPDDEGEQRRRRDDDRVRVHSSRAEHDGYGNADGYDDDYDDGHLLTQQQHSPYQYSGPSSPTQNGRGNGGDVHRSRPGAAGYSVGKSHSMTEQDDESDPVHRSQEGGGGRHEAGALIPASQLSPASPLM